MNKQEKYGFVYIWYDRKHKRYYIGCHWGHENDGYICSSTWMRNAYNRRKDDFKRKIIQTNITNREELLLTEYRYLQMIKDSEIGKRYYNLTKYLNGHWTSDGNKLITVGEKISAAPDRARKISEAHKGKKHSDETKNKLKIINTGKKLSEETKKKISENHNRDYSNPIFKEKMSNAAKSRSEETRSKISENNKRLQAEGKIGMKGRKHSDETKQKMAEAARNRYKK